MKKFSKTAVFALLIPLMLTACGSRQNSTVTVPVVTAVWEERSVSRYSDEPSVPTNPSEPPAAANSAGSSVPISSAESSVSENSEERSSAVSLPRTPPEIKSPRTASAFYRVDDDKLIFGENIDEYIAPASLTKLLTAATALRYVNSDEVFTVGTEIGLIGENSSVCLISEGHRLTLYDLITGMMLASGNDAAYTIAVNTARLQSGNPAMTDSEAVDYFCGLMNDLARNIGMSSSHFADPDGWDKEDHYTTVSDLVRLAKYALSVPEIREISSVFEKYVVFESGENITWTNSNKLLNPDSEFYAENAVGLKTGTTEKAGNCLISAFVKDGNTYISVVVGCEEDSDRYSVTLENYRRAFGEE